MPWTTPTLKDVRKLTRDYVLSQLGAKVMIPNSVLRIMSDSMAGLAHLTMLYIDWLALQLIPDTAETEWLDRHANIWLVNAGGSTGRKAATFASGDIIFTGAEGTIIAPGSMLTAGNSGIQYQTTLAAYISSIGGNAPIVALTAGTVGNLTDGTTMNLVSPQQDVDFATVDGGINGGTDTETDEQLRERVLRRIRQPPMGGCAYDYEAWALQVPGVTRAWAASEMGIGTITVRFMMDEQRADLDGFPTESDCITVAEHIDTVRPVTVDDMFVVAPVRHEIVCVIDQLSPDTPSMRGAIELKLDEMLFHYAKPGQTIYAAWKSAAIMSAPGIVSFHMDNNDDDVMPSPGHMAVMGSIIYDD